MGFLILDFWWAQLFDLALFWHNNVVWLHFRLHFINLAEVHPPVYALDSTLDTQPHGLAANIQPSKG